MGITPGLGRLATQLTRSGRFLAGDRSQGTAGATDGEPIVSPTRPSSSATTSVTLPQKRRAFTSPFRSETEAERHPKEETAARFPGPRGGGAPWTLDLKVLPRAPEVAGWDRIIAEYARLAGEARWPQLLADLRRADQERQVAPGGKRLAELMSLGIRQTLLRALDKGDMFTADSQMTQLTTVQGLHPRDYVAAHLLAQAHLDFGWSHRGDGISGELSKQDWQSFLGRTAQAEKVLEPFDPVEELSPLLAGTRYLLVRGLEEGDELCTDWYEDWSDLDPTNWTVHATHAPHLLPEWFGNPRVLDTAARDAMTRTEGDMGAAAYAIFYRAVADTVGDAPALMDMGLMLRGLQDFQLLSGCQYRANIVAGSLTEIAHALFLEGQTGTVAFGKVKAALARQVETRLTEIHLPAWADSEACVQWGLSLVFGAPPQNGGHIFVTDQGLARRD
jgi:hypothetical protein